MKSIKWGIIGCGDVTEVKSGPAFNKVANSSLIAVMRRNAEKAKDYAARHHVPKWYSQADDLINDAEVNAVYVATPPLFHEEYAIKALRAGKPVYVEKPMAVNAAAGLRMLKASQAANGKLAIAHYRRQQPLFKKLKEMLAQKIIGEVRFANLKYLRQSLIINESTEEKTLWRVDPSIAGGGLFHDLAPHQLDLLLYFFGDIVTVRGIAANQQRLYAADDIVSGSILFKNGVVFTGTWCFNVPAELEADSCEIVGSIGKIRFSVFDEPYITIEKNNTREQIHFEKLAHVQQPMIEKVVEYFLDQSSNPCSADDGVKVMEMIDAFTAK